MEAVAVAMAMAVMVVGAVEGMMGMWIAMMVVGEEEETVAMMMMEMNPCQMPGRRRSVCEGGLNRWQILCGGCRKASGTWQGRPNNQNKKSTTKKIKADKKIYAVCGI